MLVAIHDETDTSTPKKAVAREMKILNEVITSIEVDVPYITECAVGEDWGHLEKFEY
jgi:DNA polymerase I-like protein with 3'-5' exonuclease and polymerase domains